MSIRIRYFASLRDRLERDADQLEVDEPLAVGEVWQRLNPDLPLPPQTLAALNHEYAGLDAPVRDGDELAFFPPVTGG
ncbi:molybdopterin synthase sulfur carrier subunit [Plasticicumulans lactativorans]|uniref:Molybdopterin synthase sulfur carrier subunit n=1 Tax=Plasticicumulans lactativorans TaxID=1133106 RepID=A0A4R2LCT9_9GAMM|nr:MoaD/ThiS family protein [Plasticicumulans lactativorans]TCO83415.1 molybdopterin synthase sulfur carrier subunit [Plasticicumulans lactativorans]